MYYASSIALVASLCSLTLASPVDFEKRVSVNDIKGKKTFSVAQVEGKRVRMKAPAFTMLKTYAKFSKQAPSSITKAASMIQAGTVSANPEAYDMSYLCPVTVGGQTLNLDFDTGSADLWVYSTLMNKTQQTGHSVYNPNDGASSLMVGSKWAIQYGDGSGASGTVYADKVVIGSVTATSQAVEAATSVSSAFLADTNNDGLLGLAFSTINTVSPTQQKTFFDSVKGSLAMPLFTATLKKGAAGSYDFGYINANKYKGKITYVNANTASGFWGFTPTGYGIGSAATVSTSFSAIADTGTTLMYLPDAVVTAYYKQVTGAAFDSRQGGYTFPCNSALPDFITIIGGNKITVPGSYMSYAPISSTTCFGGMQSNAGIGFSIYGDIFLKSQFVVFSMVGNVPTLGFAAQA